MTLAELGSLGEFVAAIATLGTLIYLALQIRQNTETVRISASQSILASLNESLQSASASPDSARVLVLGQNDFGDLPEDEKAQFIVWVFAWFRVLEQAYFYHRQGYLAHEIWEGQVAHLRQALSGASVKEWWALRRTLFSKQFQGFVEELIAHGSEDPLPRGVIERMRDRDRGA